jgi:tetratricopeptide (TPR) repeat protein
MGQLLGYALDHGNWKEAEAIARPLTRNWEARGHYAEADAWTDRVRATIESAGEMALGLSTPAGSLWLYFVGSQANRRVFSGHLTAAEKTYTEILAVLQTQPASAEAQFNLAAINHQLGMVAQQQGRLAEAEDWYTRSLAIEEELGNRSGMAISYHQLGYVAQERARLAEAEDWYTKALAISREISDRPGMASTYHQLGMVAQLRGQLDQAEDWYSQSLAIELELGNRPSMANTYHQLGMVAQFRGQLDQAEDWYTQSLAIEEELGNQPGIAGSYHQLGRLAELSGQLDQAEDWYTRALAIRREIGDRSGMANSYGQLGLLAEEQQNPAGALEWLVRCVTVFDEFPHPRIEPAQHHLARLTGELGLGALEDCWLRITGGPLPGAVRNYVTARRLEDQEGEN